MTDWKERVERAQQGDLTAFDELVVDGNDERFTFDEGGDVLIGWSYFQAAPEFSGNIEFEPSGYFSKRNWFADTESLVLIGEARKLDEKATAHIEKALAG